MNKNLRRPPWHFFLALFLIVVLANLPSHLAYSSPAPSQNSIVEPGTMTFQCDYQFYIDGSTYLSKNCDTGGNDYQGTNFVAVYNSTTAACPATHCNLLFQGGAYTINSALSIQSYYTLQGTGMQSVTITLANSANTRMLTTPSTGAVFQYIIIRDLTLNGNKANNPSGGQGIYLQAWRSRIINVYVFSVKGTGIELSGLTLSNFAIENVIEDTVVDTFDGPAGIFINQRAPDNFIRNTIVVQQSKQQTCMLIDSGDTSIIANHVYGCVEGIRVRGTTDIHIIGNTIESMNTAAIVLQVTTSGSPVRHIDIEGNTFFANGQNPPNTNPEISLVGLAGSPNTNVEATIISGNSFRSSQTAYIVQSNGKTNTTLISGNNMAGGGYTSGSAVNGLVAGTDQTRYNLGWVTENQGSCSISASTTCSVTHGLAGTPTSVIITAGTTGTGVYYVTAVGATTFTITVTNSGSYTMYWDAKYWP